MLIAVSLALVAAVPAALPGQQSAPAYSRRNTFAVIAEYSNDSSHIVSGTAPNRKLGATGLQYEYRLFRTAKADFDYKAEWRPVMLESDPLRTDTTTLTGAVNSVSSGSSRVLRCLSGTRSGSFTSPDGTYQFVDVTTCSRQLTYAQGLAPVGFEWKLLPRHRLQPTISGLGGLMLSSKPVPTEQEGSFNFTYEFGVGLEYYFAPLRSVRLTYSVHHYSNKDTAYQNPGVDNGFFKLSYAFGR